MNKLCFLLISLIAVTSCSQESAMIVDNGSKYSGMALGTLSGGLAKIGLGSRAPAASQSIPQAPMIITVKDGDTLRKMSSRYSIPMKEIIAANHLTAPYLLKTGTTLILPTAKYHQVVAKETLSKVARLYKVSVADMVAANQLAPPYTIKTGQMLRIPDEQSTQPHIAGHDAGNTKWAQRPAITATPAAYTVPVISSKPSSFDAQPPLHAQHASARNIQPVNLFAQPDQTPIRTSQPAIQSIPLAPLPKTRVSQHNAADTNSNDETPAPTDGKFVWPIEGTIISRFGPRKGGLYNDGINISSPENTPIHAAAAGSIVYAGNELQGYGNLIIIKHDRGMVTAYAHQKNMMVKKGDRIERGQVIGHVGATGNVKSPQLHFGIREGDKAVDPELYLSAQK